MKEKKECQVSLRVTKTIFNYICRMEGKGINAKFDNLVIFCMKREEVLHLQVKEYEKKLEELQCRIESFESILCDLPEIETNIKGAIEKSRAIKNRIIRF